jgi:hypothetical protein
MRATTGQVVSEFSDYIIYADESGDHGLVSVDKDYPVFVLVFLLVSKEHYLSNVVPAFQRAKLDFFGHDQVVFHERDIRKQLAPFGFLRTDAQLRTRFLNRLNRIVKDAPVELFAAVIRKDALKARYAHPMNPYEIALLFCLERLMERLLQLGQHDKKVHVVFESRGKPEDDALELEFNRIIQNKRGWGYRQLDFSALKWESLVVPKAVNSTGMQLADLAARPIGLSILRPGQPNRAFTVLYPKIKRLKCFP